MADTPPTPAAPGAPAGLNEFLDNANYDDAAPTPAAPEPTTPAPEPTTTAPAPEPTTPAETDAPPEGATVESLWKNVKELRQESGDYRTRAKSFTEAFDGVEDADRDAFLGLVQLYKTDPAAAVQWMRENADALDGALGEAPPPQQPAADGDKPLTRAELEQILAERTRAEQTRSATDEVYKQVRDLGIDPATRAGKELMLRAYEDHDGDLAAAHKAIGDEQAALRKAAVDEFMAGKRTDAENGTTLVPQTGAAGDASKSPKNAKEAGALLDAQLEAAGFK